MEHSLRPADRVGLIHPAVDAHTLGMASVATLLQDCGIATLIAPAEPSEAAASLQLPASRETLREWIIGSRLTVLGFSYRLDPGDALRLFSLFMGFLRDSRLLSEQGGPVKAIFFAGLPAACEKVRREHPGVDGCFLGDESPAEVLDLLRVPASLIPNGIREGSAYDELRLDFGRQLLRTGAHRALRPPERGGYPEFGSDQDTLMLRLADARRRSALPLLRAHVGPFSHDRKEALRLFLDWSRSLASAGHLDVLSIGTSQLSQSAFFDDWEGKLDGGGVPIRTPEEFHEVWRAARPLLVRSYAGTSQVPRMARMLEGNIHAAWHTLSLWWFCRLDGRGDNTVLQNLREHLDTLRYVASTGKPFEANVSHHFAFRGADDVSYAASVVIAARLAKRMGIRHFVLQVMLNTPKATWGIQDLAKARCILSLLRELEDDRFEVILQPRGGLDYFSHDEDKAKAQLAAVTALMDDIEPANPLSPAIIHVVSHSEGRSLADPEVVNESLQITRHALASYRSLRARGEVPDMSRDSGARDRTRELLDETRQLLAAIEECIPDPYSPEGLHRILQEGLFPLPWLWLCRDEFEQATRWGTRLVRGGVKVVDGAGRPLATAERLSVIRQRIQGGKQ